MEDDIYSRDYEFNFMIDKKKGRVNYVLYYESGNLMDNDCPQTVCIPSAIFDHIVKEYNKRNAILKHKGKFKLAESSKAIYKKVTK